MKIAIIGSGIAGLASSYYLREHECELFEAKPFLGLAGHGMELDDGKVIDIPLRVIHPEYYPHLFSLCQELGVNLRKLEHSGSFSLFKNAEGFEYKSFSLFNKRYNFVNPSWRHLKLGIEFMRFYFLCHKYKSDDRYNLISYGEFLKKHEISDKLSQMVLYPLMSSICTCDYNELDKFPSRVLLEMMSMIAGSVSMERFSLGTHDIERALSQHLKKIHLSSHVEEISVEDSKVILTVNGEEREFDHVVMATEAHFIKNFLKENKHTSEILQELSLFPYKNTDTVIHTVDNSNHQVLDKKSLHYLEHPDGGEAQASMWLNKVEPRLKLDQDTLQTWNPYEGKVENELKRTSLNRCLMTVESYQAVNRLNKFKHERFSLAGSYLAKGVPLLEGGVESAKRLSENLRN